MKDPKALAIAYDVQRQARKRKKMASGGRVPAPETEAMESRPDKGWGAIIVKTKAQGGMVDSDDQPQPEADIMAEDSIAAAVMAKRRRMAEGGRVISSHESIYPHPEADQADLSRNADEDANEEDQLSYNALEKENYSESAGLAQLDSPINSNRHSVKIDSDAHDMVSQVRSKMKSRQQFKAR